MGNMEVVAQFLHFIIVEGYTMVNDVQLFNVKLYANIFVKGEERNGSPSNRE